MRVREEKRKERYVEIQGEIAVQRTSTFLRKLRVEGSTVASAANLTEKYPTKENDKVTKRFWRANLNSMNRSNPKWHSNSISQLKRRLKRIFVLYVSLGVRDIESTVGESSFAVVKVFSYSTMYSLFCTHRWVNLTKVLFCGHWLLSMPAPSNRYHRARGKRTKKQTDSLYTQKCHSLFTFSLLSWSFCCCKLSIEKKD